ncbi:hypothetical protein BBJ28_00009866 [Nothophytophthora sp. Chile5]|nr:hypothetical protein BBJ28_00009866 [Nothophytophthora sp. Chile5]
MATMADDARLSDASGEKTVATTAPSSWRYCLHLAYFGTGFVGWQRQQQGDRSKSGHESVQEVVELAVTTALGAPERVNVTGVSRTDTGTHALCMTLEEFKDCQGHRPDLELGRYSWFLGRRLDVQRLRDALNGEVIDAAELYGDVSSTNSSGTQSHDSEGSAAVATGEHKKRKVERPSGGTPVHFVCVELVANGFLRHMVRRIIGTLRPIGEGTYPPSRVQQVLAGEIEPGPSAPSKALWLHRTWLTQEDYDGDHATKR